MSSAMQLADRAHRRSKKSRDHRYNVGGVLDSVRDPDYGYPVDWVREAELYEKPLEELQNDYLLASNPETPTEILDRLTPKWIMARRLSVGKAILYALAANPANSLAALMLLYPIFPYAVRENPALPIMALEDPNSYLIMRAMSVPIWELFQMTEELFHTDGKRPPSIELVNEMRKLLDLGYGEQDLEQFHILMNDQGKNYRCLSFMWDFFHWVSAWRGATPATGEPGLYVAYVIAIRDKIADLPAVGALIPEMTWSTDNLDIRETVVNSPKGNASIVFSQLAAAKAELAFIRKRLGLKGDEVMVVPVKVKQDEVQPLMNLGGTTTAGGLYLTRHSHGALRALLPADRLLFANAKKSKRTKIGAIKVQLGLIAEVKTNMPTADFWLVRVGDTSKVGMPTRDFHPENIGIRVTRTELFLPAYLHYAMMLLHQRGYWYEIATGTTGRKSIRVSDVKSVEFEG